MKQKINIEMMTHRILKENDMLNIPAIPLITLVENYGIEIYKVTFEKNENTPIGAIRYEKERDAFQIFISEEEKGAIKRYIIAKLLGVFFLYKETLVNEKPFVMTRKDPNNTINNSLGLFARALLMNRDMIDKLIEQNYEFPELAKSFMVTPSMMSVRLQELDKGEAILEKKFISKNEVSKDAITQNNTSIKGKTEDVL